MKANKPEGPAALVSVARAAHRTGDRPLERAAKRLLLDEYGIKISFSKADPRSPSEEAAK